MNQQKSNVEYIFMRESFSLIDIRLPPPKGPSAVEWYRFLTSACYAIALSAGMYYLFVRFVVFVFVF
jgi:hypothetical protein